MDLSLRMKRDHWLFVRFMKINNLSKYIDYFSKDMTISQLKSFSSDDLLNVYGITSLDDRILLLKAVNEYSIKRIDQSDHESDGSTNDSSLLRSKIHPQRPPASMNRRHSIHRDFFFTKKILRSGSERIKANVNSNRNSFNKSQNASLDVPQSNLKKVRNRHLGHSAPNLTSTTLLNDCSGGNKKVNKVGKSLLPTNYQSSTSKKEDKFDSPKVLSVLQQIRNSRRLSMVSSDWSSFPSPSSVFSSHNSSQERLNSSSASTGTTTTNHPFNTNNISGGPADGTGDSRVNSGDRLESGGLLSTSDEPTAWNDGFEFDKVSNMDHIFQSRNSSISPMSFRPRAQSFTNSPIEADSDLITLNEFYRQRFPKAIEEMELKLVRYLGSHSVPSNYPHIKSDGSASFVYHQLNELASDCLEKSRDNQISSQYLTEFVNNMEQLLENARLKTSSPCDELAQMIQDLLIIISRPARLLECLEFDPKDFYRKLEEAEVEVKKIYSSEVVSYIFNKLELDKQSFEQNYQRQLWHRQHHFHGGYQGKEFDSDTSSNNSSFESRPINHNIDVECQTLPSPFFDNQPHPHNKSTSSSLSSRPPQESDFETVKLISNGAYGAVSLVRHKSSRRLFAMKKLLKSNLVLRNMVEQVFAERDILTFIDNPFVVSFYCSFETKKFLCMVLEYVEGGDCGALLKNISGPLPLDMARLYFAETVLALEYLHNFGIVHRDLKPDNLLITSIGHIKLTDFGLSKIGLMKMTTNLFEGPMRDSKKFLDNQIFGTPEYIAPEVILRQEYGKPVDWWSMGVILYQFLVGCVPFTGNTPEEVFSEIISSEIEWPEEEEFKVCDDAVDIIEALLIRDPSQRLGSSGSSEVKVHDFFQEVDWSGLLRQKTQFAPQLVGEDDTSYFDDRTDRYQHQAEDSGGDDDDDEDDENELFKSFSTCSPRYSRTERVFEVGEMPTEIRLDLMQSAFNIDENKPPKKEEISKDEKLFEDNNSSNILIQLPEMVSKEEDSKQDVCDALLLTHGMSHNNDEEDDDDEDESILRNNASIASLPDRRPHSLSGSSISETSEKKQKPRVPNLKLTSSLKRTRESMITKSSSSSSLSNYASTPTRGKVPHRLVKQLSRESSGSSFDDSSSFMESSPRVVMVTRNREGFGFNIRALKVLNPVTNKYSFQHIIMAVAKSSPAYMAGLCVGDMLTHVDGVTVSGMHHSQVVKLILQHSSSSQQKSVNENGSASATSTLSRKNKKNVFEMVETDKIDAGTDNSNAANINRPNHKQFVDSDAMKTKEFTSLCKTCSEEKLNKKQENKSKGEFVRKTSLTLHDNKGKSDKIKEKNKRTAQSVCNLSTACNEMIDKSTISKNKIDNTKSAPVNNEKSSTASKISSKSNNAKNMETSNVTKGFKYLMKHAFSHKHSNSNAANTKWYDKEESKNKLSQPISSTQNKLLKNEKGKSKDSHFASTDKNAFRIHNLKALQEIESTLKPIIKPVKCESPENIETLSKMRTKDESTETQGVDNKTSPISPSSPPTSYQCIELRVIPTIKVKRSLKINRKLPVFGGKRRNTEYFAASRTLLIQQKRSYPMKRNNTQKWYLAGSNGLSSSDSGSASMSPTLQKQSEVKCPLSIHHYIATPTSCFMSKQQQSYSTSRITRPNSLLLNKRRTSLGCPLLSPLVLCSSPISHKNKHDLSNKESNYDIKDGLKSNDSNMQKVISEMETSCSSKNKTSDKINLSEMIKSLTIQTTKAKCDDVSKL